MRTLVFTALFALAGTAFGQDALPDLGQPRPEKPKPPYGIPAAEIVGFDFLLNRIDRRIYGPDSEYNVTADSIERNLHGPWVVDNDPYKINQLLHPYQGSMYHGFARSTGHGFWTSLAYTFGGSVMWEIAGETTPPSKNDQVASGIAGSFLGESLFRMSSLVLEKGRDRSRWRELSAAIISPPTGFNRLAFGERFREVFDSHEAAYYSRVQVGASGTVLQQSGNAAEPQRNELLVDYSMDYGLPGKTGYHYDRPWDYFTFQVSASSANAVENLSTRGLLIGREYEAGTRYRGIWGLYGSYDYISPQIFRVSSTALSLGTTAELRISDAVSVQGSVLGGVGYAGVSSLHSMTDNDYHYGATPQAIASLRFVFANRAAIDATGREFFVSRVAGAAGAGGHDHIARADITLTVRVYQEHGIALKYIWSRRDATFSSTELAQTRATLGLYYAYLARESLGNVHWH